MSTHPATLKSAPPTEQEATDLPAYPLDWVPLAAVPESLRDRQCINCDGRYIDPLAAEDTDTAPEDSEIFARADSSELMNDEVILIGGADAVQGYRHMRGDKVVVDRLQESAFLSGNVTLREPGVLLLGDSAEIYSKTGEAVVHNGEFIFHREHMRGSSDLMERDADGLIHIHNGTFTYCAPGENDWAVLTEIMEVDLEEGVATARNARIEVEGVPVFYTPWLRFPLDDRRRTGFLWPDFGNDSTGGLDITVPFYMNLAQKTRATPIIQREAQPGAVEYRDALDLDTSVTGGSHSFLKVDFHYLSEHGPVIFARCTVGKSAIVNVD